VLGLASCLPVGKNLSSSRREREDFLCALLERGEKVFRLSTGVSH